MFPPGNFLSVPAADDQKTRSRVENRRDALLPNGDRNCHASPEAIIVPAIDSGPIPSKAGE